jgi:FAD/FMN-containing dehydrogenase
MVSPDPALPSSGLTRREVILGSAGAGVALVVPGAAIAAARSRGPVRELRRLVRGPVFAPRSSAGLVYNERYDTRRPLAVVQPLDVRDISAVVRWAGRRATPIVARAGGHSYAGYSTVAGGVVLDLRRLRGVSVRSGSRQVTAGAGAQLIDVYARLARSGLTIPAGSCPSVGLAGLALAGGMGLAARRFGLTCDNVTGVTIVTADGHVRRCDARSSPDLYWASRGGGGGNFGVVSSFELAAHPVASASWFFVSWPWASAAEALDAWQRFAPTTTSRLTSILTLSTGTGGPFVRAFGQFFGPVSRLRSLIAPLTNVAGARLSIGSSSYLDLIKRWAGCLEQSLAQCHTVGAAPGGALARARFAARSDYVARPLPAAGRSAMIRAIERRQSQGGGSGALVCDAYGGAINRVAEDATAFVHRDQLFCIQELAYFRASAQAVGLAWLRSVGHALSPYVSGQAYQGYIDPTLTSWRRAYYGGNYSRLLTIKDRYDPERVFAFPQGIGS